VNVGYGREELADVAREQMARLPYLPLTFSHAPAVELADKLIRMLGYAGKVYFTNSGSEANEAAFKVARQYQAQTGSPGRYKIIARYRGYHGNTLGALSATGQAERQHGYEPLAPGFLHVEAPDSYRNTHDCAAELEEMIEREGADTIAAFIMEPIIAGGGILVPPDDYLPRVREICDRYRVLLILDEVVTGFGRTGAAFAHPRAGIEPDLLTLGKGIASGYQPLAALVAKQHVFEAFLGAPDELRHFRHINTYGGHPVATAVALRNIDILEREAQEGRRPGHIGPFFFGDTAQDQPSAGPQGPCETLQERNQNPGLDVGQDAIEGPPPVQPVRGHRCVLDPDRVRDSVQVSILPRGFTGVRIHIHRQDVLGTKTGGGDCENARPASRIEERLAGG